MVGIAVAVFVAFGIRDSHRWEYLDEQRIYVSRSDVETLNKAYQKFQKRFMVIITSGIFLIIFGLCATVAADALIQDVAERYAAILFYFTAAAMMLIIPAGIMNGAYRRFIYFEAANKEKDKEQQASRYAFIWGITIAIDRHDLSVCRSHAEKLGDHLDHLSDRRYPDRRIDQYSGVSQQQAGRKVIMSDALSNNTSWDLKGS